MNKWKPVDIPLNHGAEATPVPIVADGIMGTPGVADGRLIPVLIVDTTSRPDLDQVVQAHMHYPTGDVDSNWGRPSRWGWKTLALVLTFKNPVRCVAILHFELGRQAILVDQIARVQGLWLQPGRPGDRLKWTLGATRLLVEVPSVRMRTEWDEVFHKTTEKKLRRQGLAKGLARARAAELIASWRMMATKRVLDDESFPDPS